MRYTLASRLKPSIVDFVKVLDLVNVIAFFTVHLSFLLLQEKLSQCCTRLARR